MINPNMPNFAGIPNFPGMGAMTDTLEFVKNLWGGMGIPGVNMSAMNMPGMVVPTLSVEDIRKKVADLRAVETWLELNMNMLRGTIQALEVQAATLSTLQSMGDALSASMKPAGGPSQTVQQQSAASPSAHTAAPEQSPSSQPVPTRRDEADAATLTAPLVNAAAWWNMLQDQFRQAVNTAITPEATAAVAATPPTEGKANAESRESGKGTAAAAPVAPRKRRGSKQG